MPEHAPAAQGPKIERIANRDTLWRANSENAVPHLYGRCQAVLDLRSVVEPTHARAHEWGTRHDSPRFISSSHSMTFAQALGVHLPLRNSKTERGDLMRKEALRVSAWVLGGAAAGAADTYATQ